MELKIRKPTLFDLRNIELQINSTDIGGSLDSAKIPKLKLSKYIFDCQQAKALQRYIIAETVKHHSQFQKMMKANQKRFRIGGKPRSEKQFAHFIERYLDHGTMRDLRGNLTREAGYYSFFIRRVLRLFDNKKSESYTRVFPIIFCITSLFDLRTEKGICKDCPHYREGMGCKKPAAIGRNNKILMFKCKELSTGRQEIHNYCKRHKIIA